MGLLYESTNRNKMKATYQRYVRLQDMYFQAKTIYIPPHLRASVLLYIRSLYNDGCKINLTKWAQNILKIGQKS